jgi:bla regulator protein blaR1
MSSSLHAMVGVTAASSLAILIVSVLRIAMRRTAGARAAYWLWLLLPASVLAVLLPAPSQSVEVVVGSLPRIAGATLLSAVVTVRAFGSSTGYVATVLAIWISGAMLMMAVLFLRQRAFVQSLGRMTTGPDGVHRSSSIVAPALVGAWRARVVVPENFETRYSQEECTLMLAHERAHLARGDAAINAIAAGWLCFSWFNPLMYWAVGRLRFDQELACDAVVVARSQSGRRRYADALLKSQLATEATWSMPLACHWQSSHPLKERIAMLKYSSPGRARRWCGTAFIIALTFSGSYAVWAAQTQTLTVAVTGTPIALNMKWSVNDVDQLPLATHDTLIVAGKEFDRTVSLVPGQTNSTRCVASLPNSGKASRMWESVKASAKASGHPTEGFILLECQLSHNGKVFSTPAVVTQNDKAATIEVANDDGSVRFKLEFNASTAAARTTAAH